MSLEEIKRYFGDRCQPFLKKAVEKYQLSAVTEKIIYSIGIPTYKGYAGEYYKAPELKLLEGRYLQFETRKGDEEFYKKCVDLETEKIVFNLSYDDNNNFHFINTNLEAYLKHVYEYDRFLNEVIIPEKLGDYEEHHAKYSKELKKKFLKINNDVENGSWSALIEEMGYGII